VRCGLEDGAFVFFKNLEPGSYIGRVVVPDFRCDAEVSGKEGGAEFGNQLLAGVSLIAPFVASEVAVETGRVPCPVRCLVCESGDIAFCIAEGFERRHLDTVGARCVEGTGSSVPDLCAGIGEELICVVDTLDGIGDRICNDLGVVFRQAVDLFSVEDAVGFEEGDLMFFLFAVRILFGAGIGVGVDDEGAAFAFADLRTSSLACL